MNDKASEQISALMDGELTEQEAMDLLDALHNRPDWVSTWHRYHLISDSLSNNLCTVNPDGLRERVQQRVAAEPAILARRSLSRRRIQGLKPVVGFALAASVAVVAVLGFRQAVEPDGPVVDRLARNTQESAPVRLVQNRWNVKQPKIEARLNGYLVNHSEYDGNGIQGMLPYARVVSYSAGR